ncbi:hypothetical protein QL285_001681 [Trifolium repens]|nr:hypothetical protein QL285_001681 [Trifolium repens]
MINQQTHIPSLDLDLHGSSSAPEDWIWFLGGGGSISSVGGGGSVFPVSCVSLPVCPRRRRCGEVAAASFSLVLPATFLRGEVVVFEVGGVPSCLVFDGSGVWWRCYDGVFGLEVRLGGGVDVVFVSGGAGLRTYWCGSDVGWLRPSVSGFYLIQESLTIFKSGVDCRFSGYRSSSTSDFWGYSMDLMGRVILIRVRKLEPSGVS